MHGTCSGLPVWVPGLIEIDESPEKPSRLARPPNPDASRLEYGLQDSLLNMSGLGEHSIRNLN